MLCDVDGTWLDGSEMLDRTTRVAGRLHAAGLRKGDQILVSAEASADLVVAHCAALRLGLVVVPVNGAYSQREIDVLVDIATPHAALIEGAAMRAWMPDGIVIVGGDVDLPDGTVPELDAVSSDDPALLAFTSGTTGTPKGVVLSHGNLLSSAEAVRIAWHWEADDTLILSLPLFHLHGLGVGVHGTLLTGAAMILQRGFNPEAVLAACADATMFFGVPTMYARLADAPGTERLRSLRLCVSGSAPLSTDLHERIRGRAGQVLLERYGMTETLMLVSNPYDGERRPGTVGVPLPGVQLRLDADTSEILVKGPNVFRGYLDLPEASAEAFTEDRYFRTGDIGELDEDGYLHIVGRAKELIISGGYNVYPREVEDVLRSHPSVVDAAVIGTPSEEWGEIVTAYVEATDDFDATLVLEFAARQLAPYKKPRLVHRVDELPRNPMGKVQRDQLQPMGP
ncbi:MAG: AMP-binding protein [Actinomycetota bacterium]|nr:AMP-binding protein [Actinomycetota bacterium]